MCTGVSILKLISFVTQHAMSLKLVRNSVLTNKQKSITTTLCGNNFF